MKKSSLASLLTSKVSSTGNLVLPIFGEEKTMALIPPGVKRIEEFGRTSATATPQSVWDTYSAKAKENIDESIGEFDGRYGAAGTPAQPLQKAKVSKNWKVKTDHGGAIDHEEVYIFMKAGNTLIDIWEAAGTSPDSRKRFLVAATDARKVLEFLKQEISTMKKDEGLGRKFHIASLICSVKTASRDYNPSTDAFDGPYMSDKKANREKLRSGWEKGLASLK